MKVKSSIKVLGILLFVVFCLFLLFQPKEPSVVPVPPSLIPPVVTTELLYPFREDETAFFKPRVGCECHMPFYGKHCHHFLYSKGFPPWTRSELIHDASYLTEFLKHYETGQLRTNIGGQRFSHLFAVWSIARRFQPKFVIESGKYRGWGLYNLRQALGKDAILYSIDPHYIEGTYTDNNINTHYLGGRQTEQTLASFEPFVDIADVHWEGRGVDPEQTLIILDDHASVPRRIAELREAGFRRFYIDDNVPRPLGDSLCPKYLADPRPPVAENGYKVPLYDTFGTLTGHATYPELLRMSEAFFGKVKTYVEFPPITLHPGFFIERAKDFHVSSSQEVWELTAEPLLSFRDERLAALDLEYGESNYFYCAYLELE